MLLNTFKDIRAKLSTISEIKAVQWFNAQYDGIIHIQPVIFVEFPEKLQFEKLTKTERKTPITIRLHLVSSAIADAGNNIADETIEKHESIGHDIVNALENIPVAFLDGQTRYLEFSAWQHYQKYKGWMITFIEFTTRAIIT